MERSTRLAQDIASSPWTVIAGTLASVASLFWMIYDKAVVQSTGLLSVGVFVASVLFFFVACSMSIRSHRKVVAFEDATRRLHKINHDYRDVLSATFRADAPTSSRAILVEAEERTVRAVCQQIKEIFDGLVGRSCVVTVKLIASGPRGAKFCETYARSEEICERDRQSQQQYALTMTKNTAFAHALLPAADGGCSHFHSADLTRERDYYNERQHYERFYKSAIVVPIRSVMSRGEGLADDVRDIGFLCVDTKSRNRLNNGYHVHLLSGFADQMYNFFALMRGGYTVLVD